MPDPMWRQIADDLREKIESGQLGVGGRPLPSELELREQYDASRNTVRDAVKWLVARGLVITRPGQGTFVVTKIDPFITRLTNDISAGPDTESAGYASDFAASARTPDSSAPRIEIQQAFGTVAEELGVAPGGQIISRHQQRFIDRTPWSLQTTYYPMRLVEQGATQLIQAQDIVGGAIAYIEAALGIKQVGWVTKITVRTPNRTETEFFGLPDDGRVPVFENIRTGFAEDLAPFRVTVTTYPADRNQFAMVAGRVPGEQQFSLPPENDARLGNDAP